MPTEVILPRVDMDMTEGMIAAWHVKEGDEVREGTLIFEIETSKATMEIDAPASGVIRQISAPVGETIPVGTAVAWIYAVGEALCEHGAREEAARHSESEDIRETHSETFSSDANSVASGDIQPLRATPAARRLARERGLALVRIAGSGPHGRIAAQDVLRASPEPHLNDNAASRTLLHSLWLRKGSGDPLVLLHGFAAESNSWRPFAQALGRVSRPDLGMLAVDLPAHGKSPAQAASSLEEMVAALEQTLVHAGVESCHLIGHSFGGAIALAMTASKAMASPLRVRSLTLLAPAGLGPESNGAFIRGITQATRRSSLAPWLRQLFADPSRMDDGFVATAAQQQESAEVRERLASVAETYFPDGTQSLDLRHLFGTLSLPVRVVWGQQDRIIPVRHTEGLPGRVAVHRFAGVGHLPHVEAQAEVAEIVARNIASASTESGQAHVAVG
jgi:pimeloyl-ACP methyl ester carboxylesterase